MPRMRTRRHTRLGHTSASIRSNQRPATAVPRPSSQAAPCSSDRLGYRAFQFGSAAGASRAALRAGRLCCAARMALWDDWTAAPPLAGRLLHLAMAALGAAPALLLDTLGIGVGVHACVVWAEWDGIGTRVSGHSHMRYCP